MQRFANKIVFITGAASGIGAATLELFAREGAKVFACDINAAQLEEQAEKARASGGVVHTQVLDVSDFAACRQAIAACVEQYGRLDVLANIAGIVFSRHLADVTENDWLRMMNININAVFVLCQAAMPHLVESKGNIVNISSTAGLVGQAYNSAYCASKGAVLLFSKSLAVEFSRKGVRVNAVCPGGVDTPMTRTFTAPQNADGDLMNRLTPLTPYMASPAEIASAVAYLASEEARFVTGAGLVIDGGQTTV